MLRGLPLLLLLLAGVSSSARAIVVYGANGLGNTAAPTNDPGWANVGSVNGATGVYLGNYGGDYWVATASHVGAGTFNVSGTNYSAVPGSAVTISNGAGGLTDLTLFRISADPHLSTLTLASSNPTDGSVVTMIGNGLHESGSAVGWDVTTNSSGPDTWTQLPSTSGADVTGYFLGSSGKRWGDALYVGSTTYTLGGSSQVGVVTEFVPAVGSSQAATGDSGGAMFYYNGSSWSLVGILSAVSTYNDPRQTYDNQPSNTMVEGNYTLGVSIAAYRNAILTAIPEPADFAVWGGAAAGMAAIWVRTRRRPNA